VFRLHNDRGSTRISAAGVAVIAVVATVVIGLLTQLPSRMPPDPFEDDPIRIITFEVMWEGPDELRGVHVTWRTPHDSGDAFGLTISPYVTRSTARPGDQVSLSVVQNRAGPLECYVWSDGDLIDDQHTDKAEGCELVGEVP
jgi:hypothetical protein